MAVKRYDGTAWQVVAGKGDQGTSSSISTWVKTATGGETSVSGNDDNSQPLSYTVGQELVFINGALQKRGADYTATTGNSITGLTALAANDVVTVWTVNAFSVTNAISNTLVDAKGDLIVATGADTPGILTAGTTGQVLTVDSTTGTGLKWATPAGGMTSLASGTLSTGTGTLTLSNISANYKNLQLVVRDCYPATGAGGALTIQVNSITDYDLQVISTDNTNVGGYYLNAATRHRCYYNALTANSNDENTLVVDFYDYADTTSSKLIVSRMHYNSTVPITGEIAIVTGFASTTAAINSITLALNSGNFGAAGTYVLYGVA